MNYYFISYTNKRMGKQFYDSEVIDEHPFEWLKRNRRESNPSKVLVSWKEISEEEYRAFNEVEDVDKLDQALVSESTPFELMNKDPREGLSG